ncbi:MAG TPA: trehalose-phosphatase [Puia sp.]|nr:trehalose-phosphatase [Puia sp.]
MVSKNVSRLFVVAYRLPVRIETTAEKINIYSRKDLSVSGVSGLIRHIPKHPDMTFGEVNWIGMPGCTTGIWARVKEEMPVMDLGLCPVFVQGQRDLPEDKGILQMLDTGDHGRICKEFADAMERYIRPNDTLWIQDHLLLPVASMIRKRMPEINICLFLFEPFPAYEALQKAPRGSREDLLNGMLGADLILFQEQEDRACFLQCAQFFLGVENDASVIRLIDRLVSTAVIPAREEGADEGEWLRNGLYALRISKRRQQEFQVRFFDMQTRNELLDSYLRARKRLFLLDYDGTLTPFFRLPNLARPDNILLETLGSIARSPENMVYIVSGRDGWTLDSWLGHLPVHIIAEHGARIRHSQGRWEERALPAVQWRRIVEPVMERYAKECLHSFIEKKDFSIVWHYRNSPVEQVRDVKMALYAELCHQTEGFGLQVMMGHKIIEVRNEGTDKGTAIREVLEREEADFILAVGDDRTDEDMFRMLADVSNAYTIKVGAEASFAHFNMHTPQMVISLLGNLAHLEKQGRR